MRSMMEMLWLIRRLTQGLPGFGYGGQFESMILQQNLSSAQVFGKIQWLTVDFGKPDRLVVMLLYRFSKNRENRHKVMF